MQLRSIPWNQGVIPSGCALYTMSTHTPCCREAMGVEGIDVVGVSAAIANAVYRATGRPVRSLPITVEQLL